MDVFVKAAAGVIPGLIQGCCNRFLFFQTGFKFLAAGGDPILVRGDANGALEGALKVIWAEVKLFR